MKKEVYSSLLAFMLILSIIILEKIFLDSILEITSLLYLSVVYSIPIIITFIFGYRFKDKNPESNKIFLKMPLYSIIPAIITTILFVVGSAFFNVEGGSQMVILVYPLFVLLFVIIYVIISLFLATIVKSDYSRIYKIVITTVIIIIFTLSVILSVNYFIKCGGLKGCTPDNLACYAHKTDDSTKCEKTMDDYLAGPRNPILRYFSYSVRGGPKENCYLKLAYLENNLLICEKAGYVKHWCYEHIAKKGIPIMCDKIKDSDSKSDCYYTYAIVLRNESLCEYIHTTKKEDCISNVNYFKESDSSGIRDEIIPPEIPKC